jgi:hypothetical protein
MRNDILGAGILIIIIGGFLFFIGTDMLEQSVWEIGFTQSSIQKYQSTRSIGNGMRAFGIIFVIIGGVISIAGIATPLDKQQIMKVAREPKASSEEDSPIQKPKDNIKTYKYCFECGNKVEGNPKFCYACGSKLR